MSNLGKVVYMNDAQFQMLMSTGSVSSGGVTVNYSQNDLYITPESLPDGSGGSVYPQKVFEYEYQDNWYKINVTSIDYATGVLTLAANDALFTDSVSTTVRIAIVPLFDGIDPPISYGQLPPELWLNGRNLPYGVSVGTNQIKIYKPNGTESIDSMTDTGSVDLTRFMIWAEKTRLHDTGSINVTGIDPTHRYRISMFAPYGLNHKTASLGVEKTLNNQRCTYGEGHNHGYTSVLQASDRGESANVHAPGINTYEMISMRGAYYGYNESLLLCCPSIYLGEFYRLSENTWVLNGSVTKFVFGSNTPASTKKPYSVTNSGCVYLNGVPTSVRVSSGNVNTMLDGVIIQVWDMGEWNINDSQQV